VVEDTNPEFACIVKRVLQSAIDLKSPSMLVAFEKIAGVLSYKMTPEEQESYLGLREQVAENEGKVELTGRHGGNLLEI
jgi:hypothetical protein